MRSLRSFLGLCLLLVACGDNNNKTDSRSDVDASVDEGGRDASTGDDSEKPSAEDAGQDAGEPVVENPPDEPNLSAGSCGPRLCEDHVHAVTAEGSTPWGKLVVESISIGESHGFIEETRLELVGTLDGQEALFWVWVPARDPVTGLLQWGAYYNGPTYVDRVMAQLKWASAAEQCTSADIDDPSIELLVHSHYGAVGEPLVPGADIGFRGNLSIEGAGWSLDMPLAIETLCYSSTSL